MAVQEQYIGKLVHGATWDDLRVPLTATKLGSNLKPDFDETNVGYLFPQNDATEIVRFVAQMPHRWVNGTALKAHVHWQQSAATAVTWKLAIKAVAHGQLVPAAFTTLTSSTAVFPYTSGNLHQVTALGEVDMSGAANGTSCLLLGKLYREDNVTTGDVLAWEIDFHYQGWRTGTDGEFS